jgi:hypothetical protein
VWMLGGHPSSCFPLGIAPLTCSVNDAAGNTNQLRILGNGSNDGHDGQLIDPQEKDGHAFGAALTHVASADRERARVHPAGRDRRCGREAILRRRAVRVCHRRRARG